MSTERQLSAHFLANEWVNHKENQFLTYWENRLGKNTGKKVKQVIQGILDEEMNRLDPFLHEEDVTEDDPGYCRPRE